MQESKLYVRELGGRSRVLGQRANMTSVLQSACQARIT